MSWCGLWRERSKPCDGNSPTRFAPIYGLRQSDLGAKIAPQGEPVLAREVQHSSTARVCPASGWAGSFSVSTSSARATISSGEPVASGAELLFDHLFARRIKANVHNRFQYAGGRQLVICLANQSRKSSQHTKTSEASSTWQPSHNRTSAGSKAGGSHDWPPHTIVVVREDFVVVHSGIAGPARLENPRSTQRSHYARSRQSQKNLNARAI